MPSTSMKSEPTSLKCEGCNILQPITYFKSALVYDSDGNRHRNRGRICKVCRFPGKKVDEKVSLQLQVNNLQEEYDKIMATLSKMVSTITSLDLRISELEGNKTQAGSIPTEQKSLSKSNVQMSMDSSLYSDDQDR